MTTSMNGAKAAVLNPFFSPFQAPHEAIPFDQIKSEHYVPALTEAIARAKAEVQKIKDNPAAPDFQNTIVALECSGEAVSVVSDTYFNLFSAEANEAMQALAKDLSPMLADYSSDLLLDEKLFQRVKAVYERRATLGLKVEDLQLLEKTYKGFVRNGALLNESQKNTLRGIDQELSKLGPQFSENVLKATYAYEMHITDPQKLDGLPESAKEAAAQTAKEKGKTGWLITLEMPSYQPFMTYSNDRAARAELSKAYGSRAFGGSFDNSEVLKSIARLRHQRAEVLGFKTHAEYVLEERMAETVTRVNALLERILSVAKAAADKDIAELRALRLAETGDADFQAWDMAYYSEKLKKKKFDLDEEELRPYFKLENVIDGAFKLASKLYHLTFTPATGVPTYHPDVKVFEVRDQSSGAFIGLFYGDFFPRPTKKGGAWMTALREQGLFGGKVRRPHVSIVCNFTKPTPTKPSLLNFQEVLTIFHEFGHALHGLLSECTYRSLAGTNVYWDFVELPSQVMENWAYEKEVLDLFATHYESGAKIPAELAKRIKDSANFQSGYMAVRQVSLGLLDLAWHAADPSKVTDVDAFEERVASRTRILPRLPGTNVSASFSHIFAGGYSAGYYSYKWAEVLDADAFEYFKEKGLFSKEVATSFRKNVLSRGGTEHPMELYKRFRGREPDPDALLRREGLL